MSIWQWVEVAWLLAIAVTLELIVLITLKRRLSGRAFPHVSSAVALVMATFLGGSIGGSTGNAVAFAVGFVSMLTIGLVFSLRASRKPS
jgi:hypothetical protein